MSERMHETTLRAGQGFTPQLQCGPVVFEVLEGRVQVCLLTWMGKYIGMGYILTYYDVGQV
jgi:hypothetical protein